MPALPPLQVNVMAPMRMIRAFAPKMASKGNGERTCTGSSTGYGGI